MGKSNVVSLNIPRLGGQQDFRIGTKQEINKRETKYVCSTWEGDGLQNEGEWDIFRSIDIDGYPEYIASKN